MIEIWINKRYIPTDERLNDNNFCQKALLLSDKCNDCGNIFYVGSSGDSQSQAYISGICSHYNTWNKVWSNRINNILEDASDQQITIMGSTKVIRAFIKKIDSAQDGMKCSGSCGNWTPMAAANQADGSFVCYGCRTRI
jgi:hypothetical protein